MYLLQLPIALFICTRTEESPQSPSPSRFIPPGASLLPPLQPQTQPLFDDRRRARPSSRFVPCMRPKSSYLNYAGCVALKLSFNGKTTHSILSYGVSTHFRNARFTPSGTLLPSTTRLTGTKGRSSAEATRMPYSCANAQAARKVWRRNLGFEGTRLEER